MKNLALSHYALLELGQAGEGRIGQILPTLTAHPHAFLFDGTPEHALAKLGPLLVSVDREDKEQLRQLAQWEPLNAISYLTTAMDLPSLATHLRLRLNVVLPNRQERLLRFYDPSVLPVLFAELDPEQHTAFFSPIVEWQLAQDGGMLILRYAESNARPLTSTVLAALPPKSEVLEPGHLRLNQRLWNMLRWESDMRTVLENLRSDYDFSWFAKAKPEDQNKAFDELVYTPLKGRELMGLDDLTVAAHLALEYSDVAVFELPEIQTAMRASIGNEGSFAANLPSDLTTLLEAV